MNIQERVNLNAIGTNKMQLKQMPLKKKILTAFMLLASGFFLYQGFTMLFHPAQDSAVKKIELKTQESSTQRP